jgi:hypothetical protein
MVLVRVLQWVVRVLQSVIFSLLRLLGSVIPVSLHLFGAIQFDQLLCYTKEQTRYLPVAMRPIEFTDLDQHSLELKQHQTLTD